MSNRNDPALGESLSRSGKYAPTADINGHTEHIPAPDEHPDDPVLPPRQVAPVNHSGRLRMAYRLTHAHRGRLLHVHNVGWHYWDGTRWTQTTSVPPNARCSTAAHRPSRFHRRQRTSTGHP